MKMMQKAKPALVTALLATAPALAGAQDMPDMAAMQEAMEAAQRCMESVDQSAFERLGRDARAFEQEIRQLCDAGERGAAQTRAIDFARRMLADEDVQKARACTEMMREAMQGMPMMMPMPAPPDVPTREELEQRHVCDEMR
ncbi:MAG: hypothetical protein V2J24_05160 [Pseudomonadales bacterium]|jgi:hypothetical protein|nr:hypothetical protein [Pseudomonadales bacterium]